MEVKYIRLPRFYQDGFGVLTKILRRNINLNLKKVSNNSRSKKICLIYKICLLLLIQKDNLGFSYKSYSLRVYRCFYDHSISVDKQ